MRQTQWFRALVFLAAAGAATGVGALLAPAASASPGVTILSQSTFVDGAGYRHIVGEVQDSGTTNVESTELNFNFYDSTGRLLSTDFTFSTAQRLAPGERSPFEEIFQPAPGYDHYSVVASTSATSSLPNHNFATAVTNEFTDSAGYNHIVGTVRNNNSAAASTPEVIFTFYDGSGLVANADFTFVNTSSNSALAPGESASFEEIIDPTPPYTRYDLLTESSSTSSGGSTPSPSASATTSPQPGPTPSASPSPTEVAPVVTVSPGSISAGQRVTVTYQGTPGTTLDVYSKTQPAMSYTRITSVTLDGNGYGTTTHAPTKNTRIEAITAGGLTSGQPLIQVKSVASFNAQRLSAGNYRFTGRVYPALSQRLVSLYRNGTLLAQGRCDSTGVYAIQKTLGRGSYNFFVRTSNDTYNLGTSSPSKILSIT